jgi:hypothetical protein
MDLHKTLSLQREATQGHWQVEVDSQGIYVAVSDNGPVVCRTGAITDEQAYRDALFIAEAHNQLETMVDLLFLESIRV